ncbi:MAG TPA: trehalose-6-phosphate synthase [Dehalococcoidia bacterium]
MSWTKEDLQQLVTTKLANQLFIVVSNREPYIHVLSNDGIKSIVPASGLTVALDPVMRACGGTWIAHGSGSADWQVVDDRNRILVPPELPCYTLRRIQLSREEEEGYYLGFSNEALWPLCHIAYVAPTFDESNWNIYKNVNQCFADAVLEEIDDRKAFVFIQDYHLALLSRLIKARNDKVITAQFWHIPWPNPEAFRICPWGEQLLDGLLGNDMIGFHIHYHCNNFIETVRLMLESRVDHERMAVSRRGKTTFIRPFPISVDFSCISAEADNPEIRNEIETIRHKWKLSNKIIGIGIDRLDYTKGIPHRILALDKLLSRYPEYQERIVFFQLGETSRIDIKKYQELNLEIDELVENVNRKYQTSSWKPIVFIREHKSQLTLTAFKRLADFCIVSSLHDGMNLVAKEYVSSRTDEDGVLILSRFTGAARELTDAILINPYATDHFAESIRTAIEMSPEERKLKMKKLRKVVEENNIYRWAGNIISELVNLGL